MIATTLAQVAAACAGRAYGAPDTVVTGVTHDSRQVRPGDLFVAVPGERHDGHDHVGAARAAGASAVLVRRVVDDGPSVQVDDTLVALGLLASDLLARLRAAGPVEVVGITGSVGKTSTKDLLAQVLVPFGPVVAPVGNQNNELGLPMTVLRCDEATRVLVLELGARAQGDVRLLARLTRPRIGVVLAVGAAHVGEFGSVEAIAEAKSELVQELGTDGVAVLNADDPRVLAMTERTGARVVTYGTDLSADVRADDVVIGPQAQPSFVLRMEGESLPVRLGLTGRPAVSHALAAAAAASALGLTPTQIVAGLESAVPRSPGRARLRHTSGGALLLDDSYNASPESMAAALRTLVDLAPPGARTWAVLGEMRELGERADDEHATLGRLTTQLRIDRVVGVGEGAKGIVAAAARGAVQVGTVEEAVALLGRSVQPGDVVLVKASRAVGLDRVADALCAGEGGR